MSSALWLLGGALLGVAGAVTMSRRGDREPVAMLAVNESKAKPCVTRSSALRATVSAEPKNPMDINGWAPEVINGRLAQVGFVAAIAGELTTQQTLATQFQTNIDAFAISAILVTIGTFAPSAQKLLTNDYDENGQRKTAAPKKTGFSLQNLIPMLQKERSNASSSAPDPKLA